MTAKLLFVIILHLLGLLVLPLTVQCDDPNNLISAISPRMIKKDELSSSVNDLGYRLVKKLIEDKKDNNVVISPTGIAGLLAMALLGTVGKTYDELADILGFSQDIKLNRENHELFGALFKDLNSNESSSKTIFAEAVYVDNDSKLRKEYRSYLERVYNGEVIGVDFADRVTARTSINEWVSDKTSGMITKFLRELLPFDTKAVLLSALYFKGQWKHPFIPEQTENMTFVAPNGMLSATLMLNYGHFDFMHFLEEDIQMIALPYNDTKTKLYVVKPHKPEKLKLTELMNRLNYSTLDNMIKRLTSTMCVVRFPKMALQYNTNLARAFQSMGMQSIFDPTQANFALMIDSGSGNKVDDELVTRINDEVILDTKKLRDVVDALPNPGVYVDKIVHDVKITFDEYGTEATAATGAFLARTAQLFYVDSPFYMFIRNEETKLVTFSAAIFDPTT